MPGLRLVPPLAVSPPDGRSSPARLVARHLAPAAFGGLVLAAILLAPGCASAARSTPSIAAPPVSDSTTVAELQRQAIALLPHLDTPLAREFVAATAGLPHIATRFVWYDSTRTHYWRDGEALALADTTRARLIRRELDEQFYYDTRYGTPLAYARPLELLARAGFTGVAGKRIADFGYGTIGHLRLLAALGADVTGIDVDPLLDRLYGEPGDRGVVTGANGRQGRITLATGSFPGDSAVAATVGGGYQLFLSKNTLKNGYLHPAQPVNPRMLVHLGVDDTTFVRSMAGVLAPGGLAMIYNLCPAPSPPGKPYIPWSDGRCPFSREQWNAAGFEVLQFDRDDSPAARAMAHALGWDQGPQPMDLAHDLFATYTLVRKRG